MSFFFFRFLFLFSTFLFDPLPPSPRSRAPPPTTSRMEIKDNKSSPLWLHINLWKTVSCVVLWGAAALASPSSAATATARQKAAADFASSSSSSALTPTGATFLACWNSYCLCWLLKSSAYPDPRWASPATRAQKGFVWGVLTGYLVAPAAMLFWRSDGCSPAALGVFAFLYSLGNFWHYVSDGEGREEEKGRKRELSGEGRERERERERQRQQRRQRRKRETAQKDRYSYPFPFPHAFY